MLMRTWVMMLWEDQGCIQGLLQFGRAAGPEP